MPHAKFSQSHGIIYATIIVADNFNAGASLDSINMALYDHVAVIMVADVAAAGTPVLTVMAGAANGDETAAMTFSYRYAATDVGSAVVGSEPDLLSAPVAAATLTLTEAYIKSGMYVIEWDAQDLLVAGVHYQWATVVLDAAGTAGIFTAVAIADQPRYAKNIMPTALA